MATDDETKMLKFKCSDGVVVEAPINTAKVSAKFRDMLSLCDDKDDTAGEMDGVPIPVSQVNSDIFNKVMEWCSKHINDPDVDKDVDLDEDDDHDFPHWDEAWIKRLNDVDLILVCLAADFLEIKMLHELGSWRVAEILKTLTVEGIRERFHLKNDFTPEEEEELKNKFNFGDN